MTRQPSMAVMPAALALAAAAGILFVTPHGIGLSPDSIGYIGGARNIVDGKGFTAPLSGEPITHHAPFYSLLLASVALIGPEPVQGARWLAAACFGLNVILMWQLASKTRVERASTAAWVPLGISGMMLTAPAMWEIHLMAWTEPAYLTMCLASVWLTAAYLGDPRRASLIAAGACVGLAAVTRYAGLSMWGTCCLALLSVGNRSLARRLADVALFSALGLGPFALWAARNLLSAGTATNRPVTFHPFGMDHLRQGLATAASWFMVPEEASGWVKLAVIGVFGAVMVAGICLRLRLTRRAAVGQFAQMIPDVVKVAFLAAVVYPLFLVLAISFVDANTPLNSRILSPVFVWLLILTAFGLHSWDVVFGTQRAGRLVATCSILLVCLANWGSAYPLLAHSYREGLGFNSLRWTESKLIGDLRDMPSSVTVYSNAPDAVYYHAGRRAKRIPAPVFPVTQRPNPSYQQELADVAKDLETGGVLVYFALVATPAAGDVDLLIRSLNLIPLRSYREGTIYTRPAGGQGTNLGIM